MAIQKNDFDGREYWKDFSDRLTADYYKVSKGSGMNKAEVLLGPLSSDIDDFSVTLGNVKLRLNELGDRGDDLVTGLTRGDSVYLLFQFDGGDGHVFLTNGKAGVGVSWEESGLAVVSDDFAPSSLIYEQVPLSARLPEPFINEIMRILSKNENAIYSAIDVRAREYIDDFYKHFKIFHHDEIVNNIAFEVIGNNVPINGESLYFCLYQLDNDEIVSVKKDVLKEIETFFRSEFEKRNISSIAEAESCIAFTNSLLEKSFSEENLQIGKLSYRLENIGYRNGEIQSDDIAKVAVWAQKDPSMSPFIGKPLERWVSDECRHYRIKKDIVDMKRVKLGGEVNIKPQRPPLSEKSLDNARKKFKLQLG